jgi:hypothetical protein
VRSLIIFSFTLCVLVAHLFADEKKVIPAREALYRKESSNSSLPVYFMDELKLKSSETLVFDEPARVYTNKLNLQKNSIIDTLGHDVELFVVDEVVTDGSVVDSSCESICVVAGADGDAGFSGTKGFDGLKGGAGTAGSPGSDGVHGGDGGSITIMAPEIQGDIVLVTRGGDGGRGGHGGSGGHGGAGFSGMDARTLYHFRGLDNLPAESLVEIGSLIGVPSVGAVLVILKLFNGLRIGDGFDGFDGGRGGNGGDAGRGGDGGQGGSIDLIFGRQMNSGKIFVNARGGAGGVAGVPGLGGVGGVGGAGGERGDLWSREGKPGLSGEAGNLGSRAVAGQPGLPGKVRLVKTGDPEWISCLIRAQEIMDRFNDSQLARDVLMRCSS